MTELFISKRCQHCKKLLVLLQQRKDIRGNIKIVCIDEEPFPNIIKSVPSMIVGNEIWNGERIFYELEKSQSNSQYQENPQPINTQQTRQPNQQLNMNHGNENQEVQGICDFGMCSFSSLDDSQSELDSYYASINEPEPIPLNIQDNSSSKAKGLDNDYERLMQERGEMMPNKKPVM